VGGERVQPAAVEAGTGFFEERFTRREILPTMGEIVVKKSDKGLAFGGVHWQYLDDISKVPAAGSCRSRLPKPSPTSPPAFPCLLSSS
jgi:hypothetical protein